MMAASKLFFKASLLYPKYLQLLQPHRSKHWLLKWRPLRRRKFLPVDLPDFQKLKKEANMSPDEMRIKLKKEGKMPPRRFIERPINISCTKGIVHEYVPPEGDGRMSILSKQGGKQQLDNVMSKGRSVLSLRKIKKFEEFFVLDKFVSEAQEIYLEAQNLLCNIKENEDRLHELATEHAYAQMVHGLDRKTFRWKFIESIEPPKAVHVRTGDMLSKDNLYGQITIRFHTRQTLAIYDRFGRLMYGSEHLIKDILEYVVFEKHISDIYGRWRIHGKIVPPWMPPRDPILRTYRLPKFDPSEEIIEPVESTTTDTQSTNTQSKETEPAV